MALASQARKGTISKCFVNAPQLNEIVHTGVSSYPYRWKIADRIICTHVA